MKRMRNRSFLSLLICAGFVLGMFSCESAFIKDGDSSAGINSEDSYLYVVENTSKKLLMLDANMKTLASWDLSKVIQDDLVRGITCNDEYLWISVAGSTDKIFQLAVDANEIVVLNSMDAPPGKKGTVRDLTWDGTHLWALNSGSTSSSTPGQLFKIDIETNTAVETYDLPLSSARGITYVGDNGDVYGYKISKGIYICDVETDKIYVFDERTNLKEAFDMPLHPRGVFYTSPTAISFSDNSFFIVNVSASSGSYLYDIKWTDAPCYFFNR